MMKCSFEDGIINIGVRVYVSKKSETAPPFLRTTQIRHWYSEEMEPSHYHQPRKVDNTVAAIKERRGRKLKIGASLEALKYVEPPPRSSYTDEENFRAYKLFSLIDIDNKGSISLRKLNRVILGTTTRTFPCKFPHPDTGIVWTIDEDNCVCIEEIEPYSTASKSPMLTQNLRVRKVQDVEIPPMNSSSLSYVRRELVRLGDSELTMHFQEPELVINSFNCMLDIEVEDQIFSVKLPIGAVYNMDHFLSRLSSSLLKEHSSFRHLSISLSRRTHQICFKCDKFRLALPFQSGPSRSSSCKYILGFSDHDIPYANYHVGQPLSINLNIGLSKENLEELMDEMFRKIDNNSSGEISYETFRDFYVQYLDSEESVERLRKYAEYKFRNIELEQLIAEEKEEMMMKVSRRTDTKAKFKKIIAKQREDFMKESIVDMYGNRRRNIRHNVLATLPTPEAVSSPSENQRMVDLAKEEKKLELRHQHVIKTEATRDRLQRQKERRIYVLRQIFEANEELNRKEKSDAKKNALKYLHNDMKNVHRQIREGLHRVISSSTNKDDISYSYVEDFISPADFRKVVATPAIRIRGNEIKSLQYNEIGVEDLKVEDIDLEELPSSKLHPAAQRYFFIRQTREIRAAYDPAMKIGDATKRHPAFFTADFERRPARHSVVAMAVARLLTQHREDGVLYRASRGIHRDKRTPPEDVIPSKMDNNRPRKVRFNEAQLHSLEVKEKGLLARGTVLAIKLSKLRKVHGMEVNSPFVAIQCGGWKFTSEINCFAGSDSEWDDLNWTFRVYDADTFSAKVFSGKATDYVFIGDAVTAAMDFVELPSKENGHMVISAPLYDSSPTRDISGHIEIQLFIERGQEWDWHVFDYQMKVKKEEELNAVMKKYSKTMRHPEDTSIVYPLRITLQAISIFDLKNVHIFQRNRPYVVFNCGSITRRVREHDDDEIDHTGYYAWNELSWDAQLVSETSNIIFIAYSGTTLIGRFSISCEELLRLQRLGSNDVELHGDFYAGSELTGKMLATVNLKIKSNSRRSKRNAHYMNEEMRVRLPCLVEVESAVIEEISVGSFFGVNALPSLRGKCGDWTEDSQKPITSQIHRDTLLFQELRWEFPVKEKQTLRIFLINGSKKEIGYMSLKCSDLAQYFKNEDGKITIKKDLFNGQTRCGLLVMQICIKHEGDTIAVNDSFAALAASTVKVPLITGYSHTPTDVSIANFKSDSIDRTGTKSLSTEVTKSMLQTSLREDDKTQSFRVTVTDIIATDLLSAHFLSKNSPYVNIACGSSSHSTDIVVGAGKAASWHGLSFVFFVRMVDTFRIAAWSNISSLGVKDLSLAQLLECTADKDGVREMFINLVNKSNKISGKLAISFLVDLFNSYSIPADIDGVISAHVLEPPIIVTIFTIALINLRPVHFMRKNSPIVKVSCDERRESSTTLELAGSNAKWEKLLWSFQMESSSKIKLVVLSSSIKIGLITFSCDEILKQVPDKNGLCELEGLLWSDAEATGADIGRVRVIFSKEAHMETPESDNESDDSTEMDTIGQDSANMDLMSRASSDQKPQKRQKVVANLKKSFGKVIINGLFARDLKAVHPVAFNSPFIKIRCDNFHTETEVQTMAGKTAVWLDLAIPVFISALSELSFSVFSRQTLIGIAVMTFKEITQSERDNFGSIIVHKQFRTFDGEITGSLQVKFRLELEKKNISAMNQHFLFSGDVLHHSVRPNNNSLPPWKTVESIPFVLKVLKILAIDIVGDSNEKRPLILQMKYLDWLKKTASNHRSVSSAEWIDNEWCFIIFQLDLNLLISVQNSESFEIGTISVAISDILMSPINDEGKIDLNGLLFNGISCTGKITMQITTAPYVSPEEAEKLESEQKLLAAAMAKKKTVGYLYIKSVAVKNLMQVYGLFTNSPKVTVRLHEWSGSTYAAVEGGNDFIWEDMNWGKIPLKEYAMLHVTVTSWNEIIGSFSIQWKDLIAFFNADSKHSVVISGDLYNGIVSKGTVELVCLPLLAVDVAADIEPDEDVFLDESVDFGRQESFGNGSDINIDPNVRSYNTNITALDHLSVSTSTPALITAKVLGISVYKLKSVNGVLKNSPSVTLTCGNWTCNTGAVLFGGESANWILQNNKLWSFKMKGMQFIMVSVQSSSTLIGSVAVSSRDLVAVKKDDQGLTYITRPIENSLTITGYVKLCFNIEASFTDDDSLFLGSAESISRPNMTGEKVNKLAKDERLQIPFTLTVLNITLLDLKRVHSFVPTPISVEIKCGRESNRTRQSLSFKHEIWTDLDWIFHLLDEGTYVFLSIFSGSTLVGQIVLTAADILVSTRTAQGFTELQCIVRNGGKVVGKLRLDVRISEFFSHTKKELVESKMEENIQRYLRNLKLVGHISFKIVSAMEVSLIFTNLVLNVSVGAWSAKSHKAFNQKGHLTWGNFQHEWENIELHDKSTIVIGVETSEDSPYTIGRMTLSSADLLQLPSDKDGVVIIQGELLDGMVCKAKLSLACRIIMLESVQLEGKIGKVIVADSNGDVIEGKGPGFEFQKCQLVEVSATQLAPAHKLGKNSPMLKMEINGLQNRSETISGGGSVGKWSKLFWDIDMKRTVKIKLSVSSGSALIGAVIFSSKEILDQTLIVGFDGLVQLKKEIINKNSVSGELVLNFEIPSTGARKAALNIFVGTQDDLTRSSHNGSENNLTLTPLNAIMDGGVQFHSDDLVQDSLFSNATNSRNGSIGQGTSVLLPNNTNEGEGEGEGVVSLSERSHSSASSRPKTSRGSENDGIASVQRDSSNSAAHILQDRHSSSISANHSNLSLRNSDSVNSSVHASLTETRASPTILHSNSLINSASDDNVSTASRSSALSLAHSVDTGSTSSVNHSQSSGSVYSDTNSFSGSSGYIASSSSAQTVDSFSASLTKTSLIQSDESRHDTESTGTSPQGRGNYSGSLDNSSTTQSDGSRRNLIGSTANSCESQSASMTYNSSFPESSSQSDSTGYSSTSESGEYQSTNATSNSSFPISSQSGSAGYSSSFQSGDSNSINNSSFPERSSQSGSVEHSTTSQGGESQSVNSTSNSSFPERSSQSGSVEHSSTSQGGESQSINSINNSSFPERSSQSGSVEYSSTSQSGESQSVNSINNSSFPERSSQSGSVEYGSTSQSGESQSINSINNSSFPERSSQSGCEGFGSSFQTGESQSINSTHNSSLPESETKVDQASSSVPPSSDDSRRSSAMYNLSIPASIPQSGSVTTNSSIQRGESQSSFSSNNSSFPEGESEIEQASTSSSLRSGDSRRSSGIYDSDSAPQSGSIRMDSFPSTVISSASSSGSIPQSAGSQSNSITRSSTITYSASASNTESQSLTASTIYNLSEEASGSQSGSTALSSSEYASGSITASSFLDSDSITASSVAESSPQSGSIAVSTSIQDKRSGSIYASYSSSNSFLSEDNTAIESMSVSSESTKSYLSHEGSSGSLFSARSYGSDDSSSQRSTSQSSSYFSDGNDGSGTSTADDENVVTGDGNESSSAHSTMCTTKILSSEPKASLSASTVWSEDMNAKSSNQSKSTPVLRSEHHVVESLHNVSMSDNSNTSESSFLNLNGYHFEKSLVSHPDSALFSDFKPEDIIKEVIPASTLINDSDSHADTDGSQTERSVSSYDGFESSRPTTAASTTSSHSFCSSTVTDSIATSRSPRSDFSSYSEESRIDTFRSLHSDQSRHSTASTFRPKSILKTTQRYQSRSKASYEIVSRIAFNIRDLLWSPLPATSLSIVKQFSRSYTHALVYEVVNSLVCLSEGRSYSPSLLNHTVNNLSLKGFPVSVTSDISARQLLTTVVLTSARAEIINYHAQIYTEYFLQVGATNALRKMCIQRFDEDTDMLELSQKSFEQITDCRTYSLTTAPTDAYDTGFDPAEPMVLKMEGNKTIPIRAKVKILDIIGIDISGLDMRVLPRRPYLTACKPYGNWAAETGPYWTEAEYFVKMNAIRLSQDNMRANNDAEALLYTDLTLNWYDLPGKWKWETCVFRAGQVIIFDLHDAASGLIFGKAKLSYEELLIKHRPECDVVTKYLEFQLANEYGGGRTGCAIRVHIDLGINTFIRPKKSAEYWDRHRIHHWTNYPLTPISAGVVRQKYKDISEEYDQQMIIHPCFFGFSVRWRGNPEDESRFVHPMFIGFDKTKKPLPPLLNIELERQRAILVARSNPFKWDPNAAAAGRCPVCTTGVPGCPRCFMLPLQENKIPYNPNDFAYNPAEEQEKYMELERIKLKLKVQRERALHRSANNSVQGDGIKSIDNLSSVISNSTIVNKFYDNEGNLLNNKPPFHTNLTTYKAVKLFRNNLKTLVTAYIKIMPAGTVTKLVLDSTDSVFNLYNMFCSHNVYGTAKSSMILLPTLAGMFELHPEISEESDLLIADNRGRQKLEHFGFSEHRGAVVLLFFANYQRLYVSSLLKTYFEKNIDFSLSDLPILECLPKLPKSIFSDTVQLYLKKIIEDEYRLQQKRVVDGYKQLGLEYRRSKEAEIEKAIAQRKLESKVAEKDLMSSVLRLKGHLKGFSTEEEKAAALKALKKREMKKRRGVLFRSGDSTTDSGSKMRSKHSSSSSSSKVSLSDINVEEEEDDDDELDAIGSGFSEESGSQSESSHSSSGSDDYDSDDQSPRLTMKSMERRSSNGSVTDVDLKLRESESKLMSLQPVVALALQTPREQCVIQEVVEVAVNTARENPSVFHISISSEEPSIAVSRVEIKTPKDDTESTLSVKKNMSSDNSSVYTEGDSSYYSSSSGSHTAMVSLDSNYNRVEPQSAFDSQSVGTFFSQYTQPTVIDSERDWSPRDGVSSEPWKSSRSEFFSRPSSSLSYQSSVNSSRYSNSQSDSAPYSGRSTSSYFSVDSRASGLDDSSEAFTTSRSNSTSEYSLTSRSAYSSLSSSRSASTWDDHSSVTTGRTTAESDSSFPSSRSNISNDSNVSASSSHSSSSYTSYSARSSASSATVPSSYSQSTSRSYFSTPLSSARYSDASSIPLTERSETEPMSEGEYLQNDYADEGNQVDEEAEEYEVESSHNATNIVANPSRSLQASSFNSSYVGYGYIEATTTTINSTNLDPMKNNSSTLPASSFDSSYTGYGYIDDIAPSTAEAANMSSSSSIYSMNSRKSRARRKLKKILDDSQQISSVIPTAQNSQETISKSSKKYSSDDSSSVSSSTFQSLESLAVSASTSYQSLSTGRVRKAGSIVSMTSDAENPTSDSSVIKDDISISLSTTYNRQPKSQYSLTTRFSSFQLSHRTPGEDSLSDMQQSQPLEGAEDYSNSLSIPLSSWRRSSSTIHTLPDINSKPKS